MIDDNINQTPARMPPNLLSDQTPAAPARRIERVRHELVRREVEVTQVEPLGPHFVRVTFGGESLGGFVSMSFDDHVKFMFAAAEGEVRRDYTPRRFDPAARQLVLDFELHGDGAASLWARAAAVGQRAVIGGPRGSMIIPTDYPWHLLVGDGTSWPAIERRLEELPADAHAVVVLLVPDAADRRAPLSAARVDLHWADSPEHLMAVVHGLALPPGEGFAWCAGEGVLMTRLRAMLVNEKLLPGHAMKVAAYWKEGAPGAHGAIED